MTTTNPASITTDGITITASSIPGRYHVSGKRVEGMVTAVLEIDERGNDEYVNGRVVSVPTAVTTTWFGNRTDRIRDPLLINGIAYVGHYAMTAQGRYVGAYVSRFDGGTVTGNARSVCHAIGAAVATLHATPANVNARKLQDAEQAVTDADRKVTEALAAQAAAVKARTALVVALAKAAAESD